MKLAKILAATAILAAGPAFADEPLSIATGGTGGVYYPIGGGLAEIINKHVTGYSATAEVTGASVENMGLIAQGEADFALALADTVEQAYKGTGRFDGKQISDTRAVASVYANVVQIVTRADSGIASLADLKGKRVSVGAPGSGTEVNAQTLLAANGISFDDLNAQRLNFNETADALKNGDIDAGFWSVGSPTSSILNLATTSAISILSLSADEIAKAREADPTFAAVELPGGLYTGVDAPVATLGVPNVLVVSAQTDADLVYAVTKAMFENIADLRAVHPAANETTPEFTMSATPVPLHAGSIRYFEEAGVAIPDALRE